MFYSFRPPKRSSPARQRDGKAQLAEMIFDKVTAAQRRCASALNRACAHFPAQALKRYWIAAGILCALMASWLIYQGLTGSNPTLFPISPATFRAPERILAPADPTKQDLLDHYLDSLDRAIIEDSILFIHSNHAPHGKSSR